jgi:transcriptional regulator with XRE-family HTH domain
MDADQFKAWRKAMKFKQKDAADVLGIKKRMVQYYEKGHRDGRPVQIPKSIRLACYAISQGVHDFDGITAEPVQLDEPAILKVTG